VIVSGIRWGDAAGWVSGIGSLSAVTVALWQGTVARRRATRVDESAQAALISAYLGLRADDGEQRFPRQSVYLLLRNASTAIVGPLHAEIIDTITDCLIPMDMPSLEPTGGAEIRVLVEVEVPKPDEVGRYRMQRYQFTDNAGFVWEQAGRGLHMLKRPQSAGGRKPIRSRS